MEALRKRSKALGVANEGNRSVIVFAQASGLALVVSTVMSPSPCP